MTAIFYNQIKRVLNEECGWFEPNMDSKQYILDNRLTNYPYIVVRVITGIPKETGFIKDQFDGELKVFAINLKSKTGWIKSIKVKFYSNWDNYLLTICRNVWKEANKRAKKYKLPTITIDEYEQYINLQKENDQ